MSCQAVPCWLPGKFVGVVARFRHSTPGPHSSNRHHRQGFSPPPPASASADARPLLGAAKPCMQANAKGQSECSDHTYLRSNLPCLKALQNRPDDLTTSHTENRLGIDQQHGYRPWSDMVPAEKTSSDGVPRIT
jgi:hypothetical protein